MAERPTHKYNVFTIFLSLIHLLQSTKSRRQKWSASTDNDDVFELEQPKGRTTTTTIAPPSSSNPSPEPVKEVVVLTKQKQPRNHRYTYSEYLALRNQGDQHLVAITPLMQTNQHLQSQHFRMSQSIKDFEGSLEIFLTNNSNNCRVTLD